MRFNCGLSPEEKREIRSKKNKEYLEGLLEWHPVFALIPHRVASGDCRWLEVIERRMKYVRRRYEEDPSWWRCGPFEYRARGSK